LFLQTKEEKKKNEKQRLKLFNKSNKSFFVLCLLIDLLIEFEFRHQKFLVFFLKSEKKKKKIEEKRVLIKVEMGKELKIIIIKFQVID